MIKRIIIDITETQALGLKGTTVEAQAWLTTARYRLDSPLRVPENELVLDAIIERLEENLKLYRSFKDEYG